MSLLFIISKMPAKSNLLPENVLAAAPAKDIVSCKMKWYNFHNTTSVQDVSEVFSLSVHFEQEYPRLI